MDEKEKANEKSTVNLLAVLLAFIMGLTVGNVDRDALVGLRDKFIGTTEQSLTEHSLKNRDNTTTRVHPEKVEATDPPATSEIIHSEEREEVNSDTDGDFFTVYRTPTGKKYHFHPGCAGDNRIVTDIDEATSLGLTPCKICADG